VGERDGLHHHPIEPGALEAAEPLLGHGAIAGRRGQVDGWLRSGQGLLEAAPPLLEREGTEVLVTDRQQVEGHERCRRLLGQLLVPRGGGVDAVEQRIEVEPPRTGDDDLAIHHAALGERGAEGAEDLREVAGHRPLVPAPELHALAVAKDDGAEAVPLGLVDDVARRRELADQLREHRRDRRLDREGQRSTASTWVASCCPCFTMYVTRTLEPMGKPSRPEAAPGRRRSPARPEADPWRIHRVWPSVESVRTGPSGGRTSSSVRPALTITPRTWSPAPRSCPTWVASSSPRRAESPAAFAAPRALAAASSAAAFAWSAALRAFAAASSAAECALALAWSAAFRACAAASFAARSASAAAPLACATASCVSRLQPARTRVPKKRTRGMRIA